MKINNINFIFLIFFVQWSTISIAQTNAKSISAKFTNEEITVDGIFDESIWVKAETGGDFIQYFPTDSLIAKHKTTFKIVFTNTTLYIGIHAESPNNNFVVSSLRRDFSGVSNDNVSIMFDTFNDGTNAYAFGITPYGVKREFFVSSGGSVREGYNMTWDVKWEGESKIYNTYFTAEMAIPLASLKFQEGATRWRVKPYRFNIQTNENSTWVRVPQTQLLGNLAFMGELKFEKPLGKSRTPMALIPYVNALTQKDFDVNNQDSKILFGGDAKIAIGDGLNLDLTINPDFSNVEVDDIFTNLTRFELRLPERRQFFIDNSDLFESFGNYFREARPFFSRRIGLARNKDGNLIQNDIIFGARLSGKLNKNWRLGILNLQTEADEANEIASNNNMMFALQRKVGKRYSIGAFMVNRETFNTYEFVDKAEKYNRVIGLDYNLATADNAWSGRYYIHKSINPNDTKGNISAQAVTTYNKNNWVFINDWVYVDNEFKADLGFVPRTDIFKMGNFVQRYFHPKKSTNINRQNAQILFINYFSPNNLDFKLSDYQLRASWETEFKSRATLITNFVNQYIYLSNDFDPTRTEGSTPLPGNEGYTFNQISLEFSSNNTNLLIYSLNSTIGEFFNGNRYSIGSAISYRAQPWGQFGLNVNYDGIRLPEPYANANLWLITPRMDITLSKSLFFTTLAQYSNQRENLGLNVRLQWRFAPLSDLYLVYNDNYHTDRFTPRFKSLNFKLSYWLNL